MSILHKFFIVLSVVFLVIPNASMAAQVKTVIGTVSQVYGNQVVFSAVSGAVYRAEIGNAVITRKNGASIQLSEILIGDKVEVKGTLWPDNSISAVSLKNNSLYTHNSTFSGKISSINTLDSSFVMYSKTNGDQTIFTNSFTMFTVNGKTVGFKDLQIGITVSVKGVWDRAKTKVVASKVAGTFRLININFTGNLYMKSPTALTIIGNGNVIYGVDISQAVLKSKNGKIMNVSDLRMGDSLKVWGKHMSGSVQVVATKVTDTSVMK